MPKVLADLVDSDREFQTVGAATANDRSAKEVVSGGKITRFQVLVLHRSSKPCPEATQIDISRR